MSLKTIGLEYYGDETRWFIGIVESVDDPLRMGRVRVRIFGVHSDNHSDIPQSALPWAQVVAPITHGGTSGRNGTPTGIKPTAQVFGIFLDGKHSQLPLVLGSVPKVDGPASNPHVANGFGNSNRSGQPGQALVALNGSVVNGGGRPVGTMTFEGGSNNEKVYNLLEEGFRLDMGRKNSRELAAGFVGNFMAESGPTLDYLAHNPRGGGQGANGIAQWRGPRYQNLLKYANAQGETLETTSTGNKKVPSLRVQAGFVLHEISGGDEYETGLFNTFIIHMPSARLAASAVEAYYERAETDLQKKSFGVRYTQSKSIKKRVDYAAQIYSAFSQKQGS